MSDFSAGMLHDARAQLEGVHSFAFEVINAESIPYADATFDCVIASHMLYHVENRARALAEFARVLRPGGLLFASTLSKLSMAEMLDVVKTATGRKEFWPTRVNEPFCLENARGQLAQFFSSVELRRYEDALHITDPEPLVDYLRSLILDEPLTERELGAIRGSVQPAIARDGYFHVSKDSGVYLARLPRLGAS